VPLTREAMNLERKERGRGGNGLSLVWEKPNC
jgi:hypothetical protein